VHRSDHREREALGGEPLSFPKKSEVEHGDGHKVAWQITGTWNRKKKVPVKKRLLAAGAI